MNFSRQLLELQTQAQQIQQQDGVFGPSNFHFDLKQFATYYNDTVLTMKKEFEEEHPMVKERLEELPILSTRDFDNLFTMRTWVKTLVYMFFTPLLLVFFIDKYRYVSKKKTELSTIARVLSSIETLTRHA